ncbi:MAG: arylsulfatase [Planctomycetales bacterium]|nr:arylsulfatase [Planctomycetales bacterium]
MFSPQTATLQTRLRLLPYLALLSLGPLLFETKLLSAAGLPNIVFVLCDDLGYGDVNCLAPQTCKMSTPNADQLAREGMIFSDAHSGASVCTPTRYGLLTGRYSWRSKLQNGVVTGFEPCLIPSTRPTIATYLKTQGYHTAIIGKWHLNFQYIDPATGHSLKRSDHKIPPVGATIPDGPCDRGFDVFHGFHHARDMKAVIENRQVIEHDDEINMLPRLTRKAVEYIQSRPESSQPFFLYLPLGSPHTPIVPSAQWQGVSPLGPYGDFVAETDHALGEVMRALQDIGQSENTLLIFSSDNGCSKAADIENLARQGHLVSGQFRGSKADIWEGGHRVPFIARWHGHIAPNSTCQQTITLVDLFATLSNLIGQPTPANSCEDSVSFLPAFAGQSISSTRQGVVHHSISGHFAYRMGDWKLALANGSGGWTSPTEKEAQDLPEAQLYNLAEDIAESNNLYAVEADKAKQLLLQLEADVQKGRSTNGPEAVNDITTINLWKSRPKKNPN